MSHLAKYSVFSTAAVVWPCSSWYKAGMHHDLGVEHAAHHYVFPSYGLLLNCSDPSILTAILQVRDNLVISCEVEL